MPSRMAKIAPTWLVTNQVGAIFTMQLASFDNLTLVLR